MNLVKHFSLNGNEYFSEWLVGGAIVAAHWRQVGAIVKLTLRPADATAHEQVLGGLTEALQGMIYHIYARALMLLSHRLSLDDALQESVVTERMALEEKWLTQTRWQDDRPYNDTAIPLLPLKA